MRVRPAGAALFLLLAAVSAQAQAGSQPKPAAPEEYGEGEFSPLARALRRGEIVLFGSFPLSLFLCYESYDIYRYLSHDLEPQYAPWPFRRPDALPYTTQENAGVLIAAVSVSLLIAIADYAVGRVLERGTARRTSPDR